MIFDIDVCERKIGYTFKDKFLLRESFTHISFANEHNCKSNENLEYLGDSIVNFTVAEYLYKNYPDADEGFLSKRRAELVSAKPLSEAIKDLEVGELMLFGAGEMKSGGANTNILADLFEAVLGAVYLDGGMAPAKKFVYDKLLNGAAKINSEKCADPKSRLQEFVQKNKLGTIQYRELSKTGPDHRPEFNCELLINGSKVSVGRGASKKEAEKKAALVALESLGRKSGAKPEKKRAKAEAVKSGENFKDKKFGSRQCGEPERPKTLTQEAVSGKTRAQQGSKPVKYRNESKKSQKSTI